MITKPRLKYIKSLWNLIQQSDWTTGQQLHILTKAVFRTRRRHILSLLQYRLDELAVKVNDAQHKVAKDTSEANMAKVHYYDGMWDAIEELIKVLS